MIIVTAVKDTENFSSNNANYCDNNKNDYKNINCKNRGYCIGTDIAYLGHVKNVIDKTQRRYFRKARVKKIS